MQYPACALQFYWQRKRSISNADSLRIGLLNIPVIPRLDLPSARKRDLEFVTFLARKHRDIWQHNITEQPAASLAVLPNLLTFRINNFVSEVVCFILLWWTASETKAIIMGRVTRSQSKSATEPAVKAAPVAKAKATKAKKPTSPKKQKVEAVAKKGTKKKAAASKTAKVEIEACKQWGAFKTRAMKISKAVGDKAVVEINAEKVCTRLLAVPSSVWEDIGVRLFLRCLLTLLGHCFAFNFFYSCLHLVLIM